jgi:uncharacterized protein YutE (UPF0331/DUF86 family)
MINGVVIGKLRNLDLVLAELRSLGNLTLERLESEWMVRRAVERDLQVAVEIIIDVCHRVLAVLQQSPAASSREALEKCEALGMLASSTRYKPLVSFRNLVVHRYDAVDPQILADIVNHHLSDLDAFREEAREFAARA